MHVDAYGLAQVHGERHEASVGVTFALLHALLLQVLTAYSLLSATYFLTPTLFLCLTCNLLLTNYCCTDHSLHTHCCMPAAAVCAAADRR